MSYKSWNVYVTYIPISEWKNVCREPKTKGNEKVLLKNRFVNANTNKSSVHTFVLMMTNPIFDYHKFSPENMTKVLRNLSLE